MLKIAVVLIMLAGVSHAAKAEHSCEVDVKNIMFGSTVHDECGIEMVSPELWARGSECHDKHLISQDKILEAVKQGQQSFFDNVNTKGHLATCRAAAIMQSTFGLLKP